MTPWPNGESSRLLTDSLLVKNHGGSLKVQLTGIPFKWILQNSIKVRSNHPKQADRLVIQS